jgi:EAL domain-containing protein (putative c-di-GMP-specific phosphodiesterase class I)/GGDEF domain-containing protein
VGDLWWVLFLQLGIAGSMATIGSLNVQWWAQDRGQRALLLTGLLCWTVALALIISALGLAQGAEFAQATQPILWMLMGLIGALFVGTLSATVPLPHARSAIVACLAAPAVLVVFRMAGSSGYLFVGDSSSPRLRPFGILLVGLTPLVVATVSAIAVRKLHGAQRWQLLAAVIAAESLVVFAFLNEQGQLSQALGSLVTTPIAILLAWWCSARVMSLQGALISAEDGRRQAEAAAHFQARHDELTGLPNHTAATEELQEMIDLAGADEGVLVATVQINGLDQVLAANGVQSANLAMKNVARHLASVLPPGAALARLGESTFLFMTPRPMGRSTTRLEAETHDAINGIHRAARLPPEISIISGLAIATALTTATELLLQARIALTVAELGGRPMQLYSPDLRDAIVGRARTVRLLTAAVDRDEFELQYQPVLDARSGARVSVEALVRWRHHGRLHAPAEWIPIAEKQRLMPAIGVRVLQIAARDYRALGCPIAVNVSPRQFNDPDFAATVLAALGDCPPSALILEVTESSVMTDPVRANEALELLRLQGIRIALDDFGTQYSSLSRLSTVPFDIVKIDRSFVSRVLSNDGLAIVTAIHALARALGKMTVAEGVETSMQLKAVQDIGCDLVQGFLTGRPVSLTELLKPRSVGPIISEGPAGRAVAFPTAVGPPPSGRMAAG